MYLEERFVICFCCGKEVPVMSDSAAPQWFGYYSGDKIAQAVCVECYRKGVRANDTLEEARKKCIIKGIGGLVK